MFTWVVVQLSSLYNEGIRIPAVSGQLYVVRTDLGSKQYKTDLFIIFSNNGR